VLVTGNPELSRRDRGTTALIEGFFAAAWFGWGHVAAPPGWDIWLDVGGAVALLVAVAGAVIGFRSPASTAALRDRRVARRYGIIVGVEFGLSGVGAGLLGGLGQAEFIPAWVCAVVAVHFFPLVPVLRDRLLIPLGALMCVVAVAAVVVALTTRVAASTVTGVGAGGLLLIFGAIALIEAVTRQPRGHAPAVTRI
jgi:hypothetical protein